MRLPWRGFFSECAADVLVQHTADQRLIRNSFLQCARPQGLKVGTVQTDVDALVFLACGSG